MDDAYEAELGVAMEVSESAEVASENRAKALSDFYFAADTRACAVSSSDEDEEMEQMDMQELEQDVLKGVEKAEIEMQRKILDDTQMQNMHEGDERTEIEMQRKILEDIQMQNLAKNWPGESLPDDDEFVMHGDDAYFGPDESLPDNEFVMRGDPWDWGAGLGLE